MNSNSFIRWIEAIIAPLRKRYIVVPSGIKTLIDVDFYSKTYNIKRFSAQGFARHYFVTGEKQGYRPNAFFDPGWYLNNNPDVLAAKVSPLVHYWEHGWAEKRDPGPDFSVEFYLSAHADVLRAGVEPLAHYLQYGAKEGRAIFQSSEIQKKKRTDPGRQLVAAPIDEVDLVLGFIFNLIASFCLRCGPVQSVMALPILGRGGSEKVALCFADTVVQAYPGRSVIIIVTDSDKIDETVELPKGVFVVGLATFFKTLPRSLKEIGLFRLIQALKPRIFHIINSDLAWTTLRRYGDKLNRLTNVYGSIFCVQRNYDSRIPIGYAVNYYPVAQSFCRAILSDNAYFFEDVKTVASSDVGRASRSIVYNPFSWRRDLAPPSAAFAIPRNIGSRPAILWAARLDRQKRIELVYDIARLLPNTDFFIYGSSVTDGDVYLPPLANIALCGPYTSVERLVQERPYDLFLFTTHEEGLPNTLLETGMLGVPIVAPMIGGVPELISETTGYPVPAEAAASRYVAAIDAILSDSNEAERRTKNLRALIEQRHSWEHFDETVHSIPGYLR